MDNQAVLKEVLDRLRDLSKYPTEHETYQQYSNSFCYDDCTGCESERRLDELIEWVSARAEGG